MNSHTDEGIRKYFKEIQVIKNASPRFKCYKEQQTSNHSYVRCNVIFRKNKGYQRFSGEEVCYFLVLLLFSVRSNHLLQLLMCCLCYIIKVGFRFSGKFCSVSVRVPFSLCAPPLIYILEKIGFSF